MFSLVTVIAEFIGGGITPWHRIDVIKLTPLPGLTASMVTGAQMLFIVSLLYYTIALLSTLKDGGCKGFCADIWNISDLMTVILSMMALIFYFLSIFEVAEVLENIKRSKGNA
jgi:hypothetical protein